MPFLPELRPYLETCFDAAEPGTEFVISRYRSTNTNLRTQLQRIIQRAGLKPWPKLFQNLRSTRQTELEERFPSHVVCTWIGNSRAVAAKHYMQVTEDHYAKAVQHPVQQPAATARTDSQAPPAAHDKTRALQGYATECDDLHSSQVAEEGLETSAISPEKTQHFKSDSAGSDAQTDVGCHIGGETAERPACGIEPPADPELARIVVSWPTLPEHLKRAILALLDASESK